MRRKSLILVTIFCVKDVLNFFTLLLFSDAAKDDEADGGDGDNAHHERNILRKPTLVIIGPDFFTNRINRIDRPNAHDLCSAGSP